MSEFIQTTLDDRGVFEVRLNRPEVHNAFNDQLISDLTEVFIKASVDNDVRIIVLTGTGKSFCAGADLNWMKSMKNYSESENFEDSLKLSLLFKTINECQKVVVGKINGHALGGGVGLVSVCDFVITHDKAKFGFTETRLGLIPAVISPFCINKIGESNARAWFLSGERFDARKAESIGLVHSVVELESFEVKTSEVIDSHLMAARDAASQAKELISQVIKLDSKAVEDYTCKAIAYKRISDEGQEGMNALLEKRKPNWIKK